MLTKKDLGQIEEIVKKNIKTAFEDFYAHIFEPFATRTEERFEQNLQQHKEIVSEVNQLKHEVRAIDKNTDEIKEYIKDHDKRLNNLEISLATKN